MKNFKSLVIAISAFAAFSTNCGATDIDMSGADPFIAETLKSVGFCDSSEHSFTRADEIKAIQENAKEDIIKNYISKMFDAKKSNSDVFSSVVQSLIDFISNGKKYFCAGYFNEDSTEVTDGQNPSSFPSLLHDALYRFISDSFLDSFENGQLVLNNFVNIADVPALQQEQTTFLREIEKQMEAQVVNKKIPASMKDFAVRDMTRLVAEGTYIYDPYVTHEFVVPYIASRTETPESMPEVLRSLCSNKKPMLMVVYRDVNSVSNLLRSYAYRLSDRSSCCNEQIKTVEEAFK